MEKEKRGKRGRKDKRERGGGEERREIVNREREEGKKRVKERWLREEEVMRRYIEIKESRKEVVG
jgi:hypothetical protein